MSIATQLIYAAPTGLLNLFQKIGRQTGLPPDLLLAVASRESALGTDPYYMKHGGIGRDGISTGIMQINRLAYPQINSWNPRDDKRFIALAANIIKNNLNRFGDIRYALDAYNAGASAVQHALVSGSDPDSVTTGGDYGTDVLQRQIAIQQTLRNHSELAQMTKQAKSQNRQLLWYGLGGLAIVALVFITHKTK